MQEPFSSGPHSFPEESRLDYLISQDTRQSLNIMAVAVGHCRVDAPRIQQSQSWEALGLQVCPSFGLGGNACLSSFSLLELKVPSSAIKKEYC